MAEELRFLTNLLKRGGEGEFYWEHRKFLVQPTQDFNFEEEVRFVLDVIARGRKNTYIFNYLIWIVQRKGSASRFRKLWDAFQLS